MKKHRRGPTRRQGALLARPPGRPRHLAAWEVGATYWPPKLIYNLCQLHALFMTLLYVLPKLSYIFTIFFVLTY